MVAVLLRPGAGPRGVRARRRLGETPGADLFPGSLVLSLMAAGWAWALALGIGASVLRLRESDDPGGRVLSWLVIGIAIQSQAWLFLGFAGALWPPVVLGGSHGWMRCGRRVRTRSGRASPPPWRARRVSWRASVALQ